MNRLTIYCSEFGQYHATGELYVMQEDPVDLGLSANRLLCVVPVDFHTISVSLTTPNNYKQPLGLKNYALERRL